MKRIVLLTILILATKAFFSQNQYTIRSSVKVEGLPDEYAGFAESEKTVYMKGNKVKTETVNMMSSTTEFFDGAKVTVLMEQMGNKLGWSDTPENIEKANTSKDKKEEPKPKIEKTNETKMIAGHECVKYIITIPAPKNEKSKQASPPKDMVVIAWINDKIQAPKSYAMARRGGNLGSDEIKGYPFQSEFEMDAQGQKIKFIETVTEVSTDFIPDNVFVPNTDGYNIKSFKEFIESAKNEGKE
ncbi:MAG: hypothetical protein N3F09_00565 [Bacteroidia bacterium]|nr:hypothetical protein [Bacteroidia bacterium]